MPKNWNTYKLGDIAEIIMGQSPKGSTTNNNGDGLPLLNGPTEFGYSSPTPTQFTIDPKKLSQKGDVLFCVRGSTTGRMNYANQIYAIGRGIGAFRGKNGYSTKYIKCILDYYLKRMLTLCTGSTFPNLSRTDLENFPVLVCKPKEAKAIASILSAIDDKIENNLAMNKTLEDMAMALYKHWFIDFGPFQEGKFVDSELGGIPEGWEVVKLEQLVEIKYGKDHKKLDTGKIPVYGSGGIMRYVDTFLYDSESVLVPRKGTLSNIFLVNQPFWSVDTMFYTKMRKENILKYTFLLLKTMKLADMDVGSAIPSLTTKLLNFLDVILPDEYVLRKFEIHVTELYEQIWANTEENQTLTQLRDTLLPQLISGEVRLKEFEEKITVAL